MSLRDISELPKRAACLVLTSVLISSPALSQRAPILATSVLTIASIAPDACLDRALYAVNIVGLKSHKDQGTVFGWNGYQHFAIRCSHSRTGVVFFVGSEAQPITGAGPKVMVDRLKENF